jgi:glycosyltransferase involved in cell wall biosynthesis
MLGIESRAVMPGERKPEDDEDLIRTEYANLEDADWWRSQDLDGVVLYAWGSPKYRHVAAAIHRAGIRLVLNQDNGGLISPLLGSLVWGKEQWVLSGAGRVDGGWLSFAKLLAKGFLKGLFWDDPMRVSHLRQGDVVSCVTPVAVEHYRRYCRIYGGSALAGRVRLLPHPVHPRFRMEGPKRRQVVVVGRWDDACQKRPGMLMEVAGLLLARDSQVEMEIIGGGADGLRSWHAGLPADRRARVRLRGRMLPEDMVAVYAASQVSYCPSAFESFHIASGEALCCGCSVVAARSLSLASFPWFADEGCGTLAAEDEADAHLAAICRELELWESGQRSAEAIASRWQARLHADKVAGNILNYEL